MALDATIDPTTPLLQITFMDGDIVSLAEEAGVDIVVARERAESWAKNIRDTATQLINEQLASVIRYDQP